ncbi:hypothetical protein BpHYR1_031153 [Brachionus plicatilis]|uniref:Uncharacterized protein n=1 Tax=Brachionus plicatilis TaxID=10195 RepID=A0A3M7SDE8_BRAPC|nr:hypothetical protein BpHYR1_031153 [Brachionus plicatilis]
METNRIFELCWDVIFTFYSTALSVMSYFGISIFLTLTNKFSSSFSTSTSISSNSESRTFLTSSIISVSQCISNARIIYPRAVIL